jgi:hypothetical protein
LDTYIGTKALRARPMSRGEYNSFRGWEIPADEDPSEGGLPGRISRRRQAERRRLRRLRLLVAG